ncbi:MAG TPA: YdeI/OmpD-associated family protein [Gemmatimonadales bacterium]
MPRPDRGSEVLVNGIGRTTVEFVDSPAAFRRWLTQHHRRANEVWVGYYKKATGRAGMTWSESVDEALCYGWIDGVRRGIDGDRYTIRFTPRKPGSSWSALNLRKMKDLKKEGRMTAAGLRAFSERNVTKSGYAVKEHSATLDPAARKSFRAHRTAWAFFEKQPPGYRRLAIFWVMDAKRPETRARRLATLIADSERGARIKALTRPADR